MKIKIVKSVFWFIKIVQSLVTNIKKPIKIECNSGKKVKKQKLSQFHVLKVIEWYSMLYNIKHSFKYPLKINNNKKMSMNFVPYVPNRSQKGNKFQFIRQKYSEYSKHNNNKISFLYSWLDSRIERTNMLQQHYKPINYC